MGNNQPGGFTNATPFSNGLPVSNMSTTNVPPAAASSSDLAQLTQNTASFQKDTTANINTLRTQLQQLQTTCLSTTNVPPAAASSIDFASFQKDTTANINTLRTQLQQVQQVQDTFLPYSKTGLVRYEDVAKMNGSMKCIQDRTRGTLVYCSSGVSRIAGPNLQPPPQDFSGVCRPIHKHSIADDPLFACDVNADLLQQHHDALVGFDDVRAMGGNYNCYQDVKRGMVYCTTGKMEGSNLKPVPSDFTGVCHMNVFANMLTCDVDLDALNRKQPL